MSAYYNEIDPFSANWLRALINKNMIAPGDVDERSIANVAPDDLKTYDQCHFFAGIGGWSYAARLAGWPDDKPLWTGSCPCQPFSRNGDRNGNSDERHLWPEFFRLISERRPPTVYGEQVAGIDGLGWLDGVQSDLDGINYTSGAAVIPAFGVGAPHRRDRLYFVANSKSRGRARANLPAEDWVQKDGTPKDGWGNYRAIECPDGSRRIKPSLDLLADGVPARVGRLRGYGNAIVPQVAALFMKATHP